MWAPKASAPAEAFGVFSGSLFASVAPLPSHVKKLFLGQSEKKFGLLAGNLYL
jgi:hypothetical protein